MAKKLPSKFQKTKPIAHKEGIKQFMDRLRDDIYDAGGPFFREDDVTMSWHDFFTAYQVTIYCNIKKAEELCALLVRQRKAFEHFVIDTAQYDSMVRFHMYCIDQYVKVVTEKRGYYPSWRAFDVKEQD